MTSPVVPEIGFRFGVPAARAATLAADLAAHGPMAVTRRRRRSCLIQLADSVIQATLDAGPAGASAGELQLVLQQGSTEGLARLAERWLRRHGMWLLPEGRGRAVPAAVKATALHLAAPMSPEAWMRAVVANCVAQIVPNAAALAGAAEDEEQLHQLRIGLRRLRTALRELGDLSADCPQHIQGPLADVFAQLGAQRDQDAVLAAITPQLLAAGAQGVAWAQRPTTPLDMAALVRTPSFQCALIDALLFARSPTQAAAADDKALRRLLRPRLGRLHAQVCRDGERFNRLTLPQRHQARKRLKRLRYLSEFAAPLFDPARVEPYLEALRPALNELGEYHDLQVALGLAAPQAGLDADARFALAWLQGAERRARRTSRKALRQLERTPRFWKKHPDVARSR